MAGPSRIDELRKKFDENPRRYFAPLANEYRKLGDYEQAIFICQEFLPQQPGHMSGHIVYGQALFEAGKHEESRAVFETALSLDPENLIALRHLGDIARAHGDVETARAWYRRVLESDPRNEEIAGILGTLDSGPGASTVAAFGIAPDAPMGVERDRAEARQESEPSAITLDSSIPGVSAAEIAASAPPAPAAPSESATSDTTGTDTHSAAESAPGETSSAAPPPVSQSTGSEADLNALFAQIADESPAASTAPEAPAPGARAAEGADAHAGSTSPAAAPTPEIPPANGEPDLDALFAAAESRPASPPPPPRPVSASPATSVADAFVNETMAELYLSQGHREQALDVYRQLAARKPNDAALRARLRELESPDEYAERAERAEQAAGGHAAASSGPTIREFLGALARHRPGAGGGSGAASLTSHTADAAPTSTVDDAEVALADEAPRSSMPALPYLETPPIPSAAIPSASSSERSSSPPDVGTNLGIGGDIELVSDNAMAPPEQPIAAARRQSGMAGSLDQLFGMETSAPAPSSIEEMLEGGPGSSSGVAAKGDESSLIGRPATPAPSELSLDHVFRHATPAAGTAQTSGFSFDQFFSQQAQNDAAASAPDGARDAGGEKGDDIQQFNAWLEGLKKS